MDDCSELPDFVSTLVKRFVDEGSDRPPKLLRWAEEQLCILRKQGAELDQGIDIDQAVDDLRKAGCKKLSLAVVIRSSKILDRVQVLHNKIFGKKRSVTVTEEMESQAVLFDALRPELSSKLPPLRPYEVFKDELRTLMKQMRNRTAMERLPLCLYVESATGRAHNREVSIVISAMTGKLLDETTLCQWKSDIKKSKKIDITPFECLRLLAQTLGEDHKKNG